MTKLYCKTKFFTLFTITILVIFCFAYTFSMNLGISDPPKVFVGLEFLYDGDMSICKELVAKIKGYANLIVVGLSKGMEVRFNRTMLDNVCDYLYNSGMYFIVQLTAPIRFSYNITSWVELAMLKYNDRLLGVYYFDEPGGRQLDQAESKFVSEANSWEEAAAKYTFYLYVHIASYKKTGVRLFTADYGLYWFDYVAGYDVVLAEFGWNHTREIQIAQCRGAARAHGKEWGVILTWTYNHAPYLAPPDQLYADLIMAYHCGAKYIIIFEYNIMTDAHFEALEKFCTYIKLYPNRHGLCGGNIAYILPRSFGFGFRGENDTVWGIWHNTNLTTKTWRETLKLVDLYRCNFDILYDDAPEIISAYKNIFFWNAVLK